MNITKQIDEQTTETIRSQMEFYGIDMFQCEYRGETIHNIEDIDYTPGGYGENNGDFFDDWIVFVEETVLQSLGPRENANEDDSDIGQINLYRTDEIRLESIDPRIGNYEDWKRCNNG
tara:strand:- start:964 stop:1317 length:354 start_codon:yes stop_codon:yes gene_type:complete